MQKCIDLRRIPFCHRLIHMVDDGSSDPQIRQRHHGNNTAEQSVDAVIIPAHGRDQRFLHDKSRNQDDGVGAYGCYDIDD